LSIKIVGAEGNEVFFKIKKTTKLNKLKVCRPAGLRPEWTSWLTERTHMPTVWATMLQLSGGCLYLLSRLALCNR
jgi:hypothetical protein